MKQHTARKNNIQNKAQFYQISVSEHSDFCTTYFNNDKKFKTRDHRIQTFTRKIANLCTRNYGHINKESVYNK